MRNARLDQHTALDVADAVFIRHLQKFLTNNDLYEGPVDGIAGVATRRAAEACLVAPDCDYYPD